MPRRVAPGRWGGLGPPRSARGFRTAQLEAQVVVVDNRVTLAAHKVQAAPGPLEPISRPGGEDDPAPGSASRTSRCASRHRRRSPSAGPGVSTESRAARLLWSQTHRHTSSALRPGRTTSRPIGLVAPTRAPPSASPGRRRAEGDDGGNSVGVGGRDSEGNDHAEGVGTDDDRLIDAELVETGQHRVAMVVGAVTRRRRADPPNPIRSGTRRRGGRLRAGRRLPPERCSKRRAPGATGRAGRPNR